MVCADSGQTPPPPPLDSMAMGLDRSNPLHNFNLPFLKWGNQKYLRCMKLGSDADADLPPPLVRRPPPAGGTCRKFHADRTAKRFRASKFKIHDDFAADEGIAAVREKLMIDLKTAADKMKVTFWRDGVDDEEEENPKKKTPAPPLTTSPVPAPPSPPWSLRVRKAASKRAIRESPVRSGDGGGGGGKSPRRRCVTENKEREKFSVSLSKKEIEEDFMAMIDRRPPRRPKKRPRIVQNQIDTLFPGSWLTEITADLYDVPETQ